MSGRNLDSKSIWPYVKNMEQSRLNVTQPAFDPVLRGVELAEGYVDVYRASGESLSLDFFEQHIKEIHSNREITMSFFTALRAMRNNDPKLDKLVQFSLSRWQDDLESRVESLQEKKRNFEILAGTSLSAGAAAAIVATVADSQIAAPLIAAAFVGAAAFFFMSRKSAENSAELQRTAKQARNSLDMHLANIGH